MKKIFLFVILFCECSSTFCQTNGLKKTKIKEQIIALEEAGWSAWKSKNAAWFRENTTEECLWISSAGIVDKTQMIKSLQSDCSVESIVLDSFTFITLNANSVFLTYVALQDGYCDGKKLPEKIRASVNYLRRKGKWLEAAYMETPVTP